MPTGYPGTKTSHGTITRYIHHGCRCEDCRNASRVYYGHRPRQVVDAERAARHGTESKYNKGCRCDECRVAAASARNARRIRRMVSCVRCGQPRLDHRDVGGRYTGSGTGLCRPCYEGRSAA